VTTRESAAVAQELIEACCKQQRVARDQLTIHTDRGSPRPTGGRRLRRQPENPGDGTRAGCTAAVVAPAR
jgi:hypothetical protein